MNNLPDTLEDVKRGKSPQTAAVKPDKEFDLAKEIFLALSNGRMKEVVTQIAEMARDNDKLSRVVHRWVNSLDALE